MRLQDLIDCDNVLTFIGRQFVTRDSQYMTAVEKGLPFFTEKELTDIERARRDGLTVAQIEEILARKGVILKPATFKRYVGSGLISGTETIRRDGERAWGVYPAKVIREINWVKYCLYCNRDLKELILSILTVRAGNVLDVLDADHSAAIDITDQLSYGGDYTLDRVSPVLDSLIGKGAIPKSSKRKVEQKIRAFQESCDSVWEALRSLQAELSSIELPLATVLQLAVEEKSTNGEQAPK